MHSDLQEIIQQGENSSVEFKEYGVRVESLAKEIVAFANTQVRLFQASGIFHYDGNGAEDGLSRNTKTRTRSHI